MPNLTPLLPPKFLVDIALYVVERDVMVPMRDGVRLAADIYYTAHDGPNTGEPLNDHRHTIVARNTIYHDAAHPSHAILPVIPLQ